MSTATWIDRARAFIAEATKDLPPEVTLKERRALLRSIGWQFHGNTHWGRKKWALATREHLVCHGAPPRKARPVKNQLRFADDIIFPFREQETQA